MEEMVFLNNELVPVSQARVSAFDAGFAHAAGLFETMRAYGGVVMRFGEHYDRLFNSAATIEMRMSVPREALEDGIAQLLQANNLKDARLRLTVTPGIVPRPGRMEGEVGEPTILITAEQVKAYPPELYETGMRVCICPYKQNRLDPLAGHKTLAYLPRLLALREAVERKCNEALWFNTDNQLAEGSICNVFIVQNDGLATPPLNTPVLPGTVRKAVIELAKANGIPIAESPIDINALLAAKEVFLTNSVMEIMPVMAIEKHEVGDGKPGDMAKRMLQLYTELVTKECGHNG